ncbi:hypothetical protein IWQ60_011395, partial [Tieghemiomyces parasiticus]
QPVEDATLVPPAYRTLRDHLYVGRPELAPILDCYRSLREQGRLDHLTLQDFTLVLEIVLAHVWSRAARTTGPTDQPRGASARRWRGSAAERADLDMLCRDFMRYQAPVDALRRHTTPLPTAETLTVKTGLRHLAIALCYLDRVTEAMQLVEEQASAGLTIAYRVVNTLLDTLTEHPEPQDGRDFLDRLPRYDVQPTRYTYGALLRLAQMCDGLESAELVLAQWETRSHLTPDFVFVSLFSAYVGRKRPAQARRWFDKVQERRPRLDMQDTSRLIAGLAQLGEIDRAFTYYERLAQQTTSPSLFVLDNLLNAALRADQPARVDQIYADVIRFGIQPDGFLLANLIRAYGQRPDGGAQLREVLARTERGGGDNRPIAVFNQLISLFAKQGDPQRAVEMYEHVRRKRSPQPNEHTYAIMLKLALDHPTGDLLHRVMTEVRTTPDLTWDRPIYSLMVRAHMQHGEVREARAVFDQMLAAGLEPDIFVYTHLVGGLCRNHEFDNALAVKASMFNGGVKPTYSIYRELVLAAIKLGRFDVVRSLVGELKAMGMSTDSSFYATIISGFLSSRRNDLAVATVEDCLRMDVPLDTAFYTAAVTTYARAGRMSDALGILNQLRTHLPTSPSTVKWNAQSNAAHPRGHHRATGQLDAALISALLQGCQTPADARHVATLRALFVPPDAPPNLVARPDTLLYNLLIKAYRETGQPDAALAMWDTMINQGRLSPNNSTLVFMFETCAKYRRPEAVHAILARADERGLKLNSTATASLIRTWCVLRDAANATRLMTTAARQGIFLPTRKVLMAVYMVALLDRQRWESQCASLERWLANFYPQLFPEMARLKLVSPATLESTLDDLLSNDGHEGLFEQQDPHDTESSSQERYLGA